MNSLKRLSLPIAFFLSLLPLYLVASYSFRALADFYQYQAVVAPDVSLTVPRFHYFLNNRVRKTWLELSSPKPLSDDQSALKTFSITVDQKDIERLNANLPDSGKNQFINAYMKVSDDSAVKKIKLRYRGDNNYHWLYDKKSLRIKLRGGVYNMEQTFNLINPVEMSSYRDVVNYALARKLGLLAPDSYPVRVKINDRYMGAYLYLSQVDESLLRKNKRMPGSIYYGDLGIADNIEYVWDAEHKWQKKASRNRQQKENRDDISLLITAVNDYTPDEFIQFTETYLNKPAFFKFIALDRLFGSHHHDFVHNHKIYFDPYKGTFEPIAWDIRFWSKQPQKDRSLYPIQLKLASHAPYDAEIDKMVYQQIQGAKINQLLADYQAVVNRVLPDLRRDIYRDAAAAVNMFANKAVSSPFSIAQFERTIQTDKVTLAERIDGLRQRYQEVDLKYAIQQTSPTSWGLNVRVDGNNPIEVDFSSLNNRGQYQIVDASSGQMIPSDAPVVLYPSRQIVAGSQDFLPVEAYGDETVQAQAVNYTFSLSLTSPKGVDGAAEIMQAIKFSNAISEQPVTSKQLQRIASEAFANVPFAPITSIKPVSAKQLTLSGTIEVTTSRTYSRDTRVHIKPGTNFIMHPGASLFFYGRVIAEGNASQPIIFAPKDASKPWGVIAVQGPAASGSRFSYCQLHGGSVASKQLINYTAPLSLHHLRDFSVKHCKIGRNYQGDDAMHVAYATGVIEYNEFNDARSDALDIDISEVSVNHNGFYNSGNDALDIMTTQLTAHHNIYSHSGDKGLSVGEWSQALIGQSIFNNNHIALEVKDQSVVTANELMIENSQHQAINLYLKNKRYSKGGTLSAHNIAISGNKDIAIDATSELKKLSELSAAQLRETPWFKALTDE